MGQTPSWRATSHLQLSILFNPLLASALLESLHRVRQFATATARLREPASASSKAAMVTGVTAYSHQAGSITPKTGESVHQRVTRLTPVIDYPWHCCGAVDGVERGVFL
ncbi:hypothetical protein BDQ17DRAFT_1544030 [Cyathus striatus]|nr:hypothetical protein BDQ17DRAFT_1544030 [Cyathus striatus]